MKLLIAIPAFNEENSIASVIERTIAARERIRAETDVTEVDITVVSDGSTDRTARVASAYEGQVKLIVFPENRGYGAAIQQAWGQSDAELLSFLDADGTCDPNFFVDLCKALKHNGADIVLGCRMHGSSRMPLVRRIGNSFFAFIVTVLAFKHVRDTASGMRIIRRTILPKLLPLPDGLHFTPAITARALLGQGIKITEINMPYHER